MEISASKLKVFVTCPLQFYYNYVLRLIQPISDALLTGTRYHSIIQKYHDNEEVEFKDTKDIVTLKGLFEKYKLNPVKGVIIDSEYKFKVTLNDVIINGIIDRLDQDKIVEYKTSSFDYKDVDTKNWQTDLYIWAMWKMTGIIYKMVYSVNNKKKIKTKKYLPQIIEVNKTVEEIVDIESRLVAKLAEMDVAMKTKDFKPCPSQACFWCAFGSGYNGTNNCPYSLKGYDKKK